MNLLLLISETLLFVFGGVMLFRRERMYGVYFLLLYAYVVFAQVGYLYVPELSLSLFAYFGEQVWRPITYFVILSGGTLYLFLRYAADPLKRFFHRHVTSHVDVKDSRRQNLEQKTTWFIGTMLLLEVLLFAAQFGNISWENAQQENLFSLNPALGVFVLLVKLSVGINLSLYCLIRQPSRPERNRVLLLLFASGMLCFFGFTFRLGNRTDDVAIIMGILIFETSRTRLRVKHFAIVAASAAIIVLYLNFLEAHRYEDGPADMDFAAKILLKDYFSPAHILFAAVANDVVTPLTVLESNAGNALMFLGQPYLQAGVMDTFRPGLATRSASYGFYPLTEGYLFAGFVGFLYNALVLGGLLVLWRSLATTNSKRLNSLLLALLGSMLVNLVRGQSSYFIKYLYTFVLPNVLLYLCLTGQRLHWVSAASLRIPKAAPVSAVDVSALL